MKSCKSSIETFLIDLRVCSCNDVIRMTSFREKFPFVSNFMHFNEIYSDIVQTFNHLTDNKYFTVRISILYEICYLVFSLSFNTHDACLLFHKKILPNFSSISLLTFVAKMMKELNTARKLRYPFAGVN